MILLIDNYDSFTYNLLQGIEQLGESVQVVRNDCINLEMINTLNPKGIIISPGPGRPENAGQCVEIIKTYADKIPMLGVCLGHQAIAYAFGAKITHANTIMHGKASHIFHNRSNLYKNLSLPFEGARYHSLIVDKTTLPNTLMIEAETHDEVIMGIRHAHHPIFGVQFHPESILSKEGQTILGNFLAICHQKEHAIC